MNNAPSNANAGSIRAILGAAALIAIGNIASRVLGLGRESALSYYFGVTSAADAFTLAWTVPNTLFDLLINGAVSAALVPVLTEYAEGDEEEFGRVAATVFSIVLGLLAALIAIAAWQAPFLTSLLVQPEQAELRVATEALVRGLLPAVLMMGISGLATALLHAKRSFLAPAFVGAAFNLGMIIAMFALAPTLGVASLAIGASLGAAVQVLIQLPGLRRVRWRAGVDFRHPAVRRIGLLYAPVLLGIGFSIIGSVIDRNLASGFAGAPAVMRYATTLIQFPLGLVAAAVSLAVLPTLARQSTAADEESFRRTLAMGLKVVLILIIPATVGLAVLAQPLTSLLFERGEFGAEDTPLVALALLFYLPGLPAAALDQVLLFAFYARKKTLVPNLVQGAAIGFYLLSALPLLWFSELGFLALVIGNSVQWISHLLVLWLLLRRDVSLGGLGLATTALKAALASLGLALVVWGGLQLLSGLPTLLQIAIAGGVGSAVYLGLGLALRIEALTFFLDAIQKRLRRGK